MDLLRIDNKKDDQNINTLSFLYCHFIALKWAKFHAFKPLFYTNDFKTYITLKRRLLDIHNVVPKTSLRHS